MVPLQCEYYAMEGLGQFIRTTELVRKGLNRNLKQLGILLTMFDSRNNLARQVVLEVKNHFKDGVFETVIPRNVKLSESPSHGKPALLYDISSSGSQSYLALAQEIIQRVEKPKMDEDFTPSPTIAQKVQPSVASREPVVDEVESHEEEVPQVLGLQTIEPTEEVDHGIS